MGLITVKSIFIILANTSVGPLADKINVYLSKVSISELALTYISTPCNSLTLHVI